MIREELFWAKRVPCERLEAPYEAYRLDYGQFKTLFTALSPWAKGDYAEAITARMFKVCYFFVTIVLQLRRSYPEVMAIVVGSLTMLLLVNFFPLLTKQP